MSSRILELLKDLEPYGKILDKIVIIGEDRETKDKENTIEVSVNGYDEMDRFGEKNNIYGVNITFENGTKIEFVYDREWSTYAAILTDGRTLYGRHAKSHFLKMKPKVLKPKVPKPKRLYTHTIDLRKIGGEGDFPCPSCGVIKSPDDMTNTVYKMLKTKTRYDEKGNIVYGVVRCNNCKSKIKLEGFNL